MDTSIEKRKSLHPLVWGAGVALILLSIVGIAAMMGWLPNAKSDPADALVAVPPIPAVASSVEKPHATPTKRHTNTTTTQNTGNTSSASPVGRCGNCGVIESVRTVETKGTGSGLGAVGGGVVGGLLGNQVGGGHGKDAMTIVGAIGGAMAGNEVEKRSKSTTSYSITVRYEDGSSGVFSEPNLPSWHAGDKIKVVNGAIQSNS
jgi:outer membrane lipoprotein SlyB